MHQSSFFALTAGTCSLRAEGPLRSASAQFLEASLIRISLRLPKSLFSQKPCDSHVGSFTSHPFHFGSQPPRAAALRSAAASCLPADSRALLRSAPQPGLPEFLQTGRRRVLLAPLWPQIPRPQRPSHVSLLAMVCGEPRMEARSHRGS